MLAACRFSSSNLESSQIRRRALRFPGGGIKARWHRELPSQSKSAILTRQLGKWYIVFHIEGDAVDRAGSATVGIDLGLTSLVALSTGETIARPNWTRAARNLRLRQRDVARCKRGSRTRARRVAAPAKYEEHLAVSIVEILLLQLYPCRVGLASIPRVAMGYRP